MPPETNQADQNNPQNLTQTPLQPDNTPQATHEVSPIIQGSTVNNLDEVKKVKRPIGRLAAIATVILVIYLVHFAIQWNCTTECDSIKSYSNILYIYQAVAPFVFFPIVLIIFYRMLKNFISK